MSGLNLIQSYLSDSESDEECDSHDATVTKNDQTLPKLPLPQSILSWEGVEHHQEVIDDTSEHDGRVRSFKHERGNWPTLVYLEYIPSDSIRSWIRRAPTILEWEGLKATEDLHLSLTRSLTLKYHWIDSFAESVKSICQRNDYLSLEFTGLRVYCNEEKTRTFLGMCCEDRYNGLARLIANLDELLAEYQLPPFYMEASFHVSIFWCLGDSASELNARLPMLQKSFDNLFLNQLPQNYVQLDTVHCKIGNKLYKFRLKHV